MKSARPRHRVYAFFRTRWASRSLWSFCKFSLKLRDQSRHRFRLFIRGEVTAGQAFNMEAEIAQSFLREIDPGGVQKDLRRCRPPEMETDRDRP